MSQAKEYFHTAKSKENEGRFQEALKYYKKTLESDKTFRPAFMQIGSLYSRAGKPDMAIAVFSKALELSDDAIVRFNLGSEHFKSGNISESRKHLIQALKKDSRMLRAHVLLAYVYGKEKQYDRAAIYFQNALKLEPRNRLAILGYVVSLSEQGKYAEALALLEKGPLDLSNDEALRNLRAGLLLKTGQLNESLKDYSELTKSSSSYKSFTDHLNSARKEQDENYEKMFSGIDNKIQNRLGRAKETLARRKQASASGEKIEPATKDELQDLVDLSFLHLFSGDTDRALKLLFQAKKIGTDSN